MVDRRGVDRPRPGCAAVPAGSRARRLPEHSDKRGERVTAVSEKRETQSNMDPALLLCGLHNSSALAYPPAPPLMTMLQTRFLLSKGFGWQDDLEFCPVVLDAAAAPGDNASGAKTAADSSQHYFVPTDAAAAAAYTLQHSPPSSAASSAAAGSASTAATSPNTSLSARTASPLIHTPRAKKILDIVNPHTGLRVGSPSARTLQ